MKIIKLTENSLIIHELDTFRFGPFSRLRMASNLKAFPPLSFYRDIDFICSRVPVDKHSYSICLVFELNILIFRKSSTNFITNSVIDHMFPKELPPRYPLISNSYPHKMRNLSESQKYI